MMTVKDYLSTFKSPQYEAVTGRQQPFDAGSAVRGLAGNAQNQWRMNQEEGQWKANVMAEEERKKIAQSQANKGAMIQGGGLAVKAGDLANKYGAFDKVKGYFSNTEIPTTESVANYFPSPEQMSPYDPSQAIPEVTDPSLWGTALDSAVADTATDTATDIGAGAANDVVTDAATSGAAGLGASMGTSAIGTGLGMATEELTGSEEAGKAVKAGAEIAGGFAAGPVGGAVMTAKNLAELLADFNW